MSKNSTKRIRITFYQGLTDNSHTVDTNYNKANFRVLKYNTNNLYYYCFYLQATIKFIFLAVETLNKCPSKDNECIKNLYMKVVKHIGSNGLSEYGIPPVDPIALKNVTVSLFGAIDLILVEGTAKGVSECEFDVFK